MHAAPWRRLGLMGGLVPTVLAAGALAGAEPSAAGDRLDPAACDHSAHAHPSPEHRACLRREPASASRTPAASSSTSVDRDTMELNDEPGNWFRSDATGTPVTRVPVGGRVDFRAGKRTNTRHTATLVIKPVGSRLEVDQDSSESGGIDSARFDVPGLYVFLCKVHPYMTGAVLVEDASGGVPDVTPEQLPFVGHLGLPSLPASAVLAAITTVASTDAEKLEKWEIGTAADQLRPAVPGVGEVWVNTQFEEVPGQTDDRGFPKPGTITVVDAATFAVTKEVNGLGPEARFRWNNPHNMWVNTEHSIVYNAHWFGRWHNKIARATGDVLTTVDVGHSPTHTVSNPNEASEHFEHLTLPLSAEKEYVELEDVGGFDALQRIIDKRPTGFGRNHPHGQWLTSDGGFGVFPNVFKGLGVEGGIGVVDLETHRLVTEFRGPAITMPVATGIQSVAAGNKAYVSNIVSGQVSVIDLDTMRHVKDIPVTLTPDCLPGAFDVFETLQVPIQPPVSPDGRFVAVAVLSLTTVPRACTGSADHVAVIDTTLDEVVRYVPTLQTPGRSSGTHGTNFGAKLGGGYYVYVANQHSNMMGVVDLDPNGDGSALDAAQVGRIFLGGEGLPGVSTHVTDGVGGQGIKPLPTVYDGWVQDTVAADAAGRTDPEVRGWIAQLTACQKNPSGAGCSPAGPGR
jgi:YVTN family beta-propeller protein